MTLHAKQPTALLFIAQAAMNDAWAGNRNEARRQAQKALQLSSDAKEKPSQPWPWRLQATREALRLANDLANRFPENTMVRDQYVP